MTDPSTKTATTGASKKAPSHVAYKVRDAGEKSHWDRIGVAFEHKDKAGLDLILDCVPVDGRVSLRRPSDKQQEKEAA
jgi:hypothetical protein